MGYTGDFSTALKGGLKYLNAASQGLAPDYSIGEAHRALELQATDPDRAAVELWSEVERLRGLVESLYGFPRERVGVGESTSHCLQRMITSLGHVRIAYPREEFPGVILLLKTHCRRAGCTLAPYEGRPEEALKAAVDDGVEALLVSAVSWVTGYRADLAEITRYAHRRGVIVIVDAVQHFGALILREGEGEADGYASSTRKWLLAPHSNTALCVAGDRLLGGEPASYGLGNASITDWGAYWSNPDKRCDDDLPLRRDGHRYSAPTGLLYNSVVAARASLEYLTRIGIVNVERHISRLREELIEGLGDLGLTLPAAEYGAHRLGGIVSFDAGGYDVNKRLYSDLTGAGFSVSLRGQDGYSYIRVSPHVYNTSGDVSSFLSKLKVALKDLGE